MPPPLPPPWTACRVVGTPATATIAATANKTMTVPQPLSPGNIRKELKSILKMLER